MSVHGGRRRSALVAAVLVPAGLGGAIVGVLGDWSSGGARFDSFQIGVYDGTEEASGHRGGAEFFFLSRGRGPDGATIWRPLPTAEERQLFGDYQFADRGHMDRVAATCR